MVDHLEHFLTHHPRSAVHPPMLSITFPRTPVTYHPTSTPTTHLLVNIDI